MANDTETGRARRSGSGISPVTLVISTVAAIWLAYNAIIRHDHLLYLMGFLVFLAQLIVGGAALFLIMRADKTGRLESSRAQTWCSVVIVSQAAVLALLALAYSAAGTYRAAVIMAAYALLQLILSRLVSGRDPHTICKSAHTGSRGQGSRSL